MADPLVSAIVSSIIGAVVEGAITPTPPEPAMGIIRMLPEETRYGEMRPPVQWQVQIDGKTYPLSPGAQIRNKLNMIVLPTMVDRPVKVRYLVDHGGAVYRIWILTSAEVHLSEQR